MSTVGRTDEPIADAHRLGRKITMTRFCLACISLFLFTMGCTSTGNGQSSKNMKLVGTNDLQARSSYEVQVYKQGTRYIAYVGHHTLTGPSQYSSGAGEGL